MPTPTAPSPLPGTSLADTARSLVESDEHELPVLPEVSVQLMQLTSDVNCDPLDIVELFKRDQTLTGHLLKTANSTRYTCGLVVTSIQQAVARLGLLQVREIVMLISCQSRIFNVAGFEKDVRASFDLSLATAAFSQEIARVRRLNVEDAFLCGLMHDIGRPVLLQALSDVRHSTGLDFTDDDIRHAAEQMKIPMASRLITSWDLPERLATIIEHQATPVETAEYDQQAAMLNLAIDLAATMLDPGAQMPEELDHPMLDVLNLYPEDFEEVLARHTAIQEWVRASA